MSWPDTDIYKAMSIDQDHTADREPPVEGFRHTAGQAFWILIVLLVLLILLAVVAQIVVTMSSLTGAV